MAEGSASIGAAAGSAAVGSAAAAPIRVPADGSDVDPFAERPELFVGGAFVGGLALAILLRRLSSD